MHKTTVNWSTNSILIWQDKEKSIKTLRLFFGERPNLHFFNSAEFSFANFNICLYRGQGNMLYKLLSLQLYIPNIFEFAVLNSFSRALGNVKFDDEAVGFLLTCRYLSVRQWAHDRTIEQQGKVTEA